MISIKEMALMYVNETYGQDMDFEGDAVEDFLAGADAVARYVRGYAQEQIIKSGNKDVVREITLQKIIGMVEDIINEEGVA